MGTTTETRITSTQAKDAIYKAHSINSSASEIDDSVGFTKFKHLPNTFKVVDSLILSELSPSGSNTAGTVLYVPEGEYGENVIKITHTSSAGRIWYSKNINIPNSDFIQRGGFLAQKIKILSTGIKSKIVFYLTMSDGSSYNLYPDVYFSDRNVGLEWQWISFGLNEMIPIGSAVPLKESTANLVKFSIGTLSAENGFSICISDFIYGLKQKPTFSFSFDDGNITDYTIAKKILDFHNFKATTGIIGKYIAWGLGLNHSTGYLSDAQIISLHTEGWDIACHGEFTHSSLATYDAIKTDMKYNLAEIRKINNISPSIYTYVGGKFLPDSFIVLDELGIEYAMTIFLMNAPLSKHHKKFIGRRETTAYTIEQLKTLVDTNIANGGHLDLYTHLLVDTPATYHTVVSIFKELVSYIAEKTVNNECEVVLMKDVLKNIKS